MGIRKGASHPDEKGSARTARERVLEVAEELFYREGVRAVGVDTIVARSGVAKMSLYRNFPSKDDLVLAYLRLRSDRFWRWWDDVTAPLEGAPREQLLAVFAALVERVSRPGFRGCPFINAATEFPDTSHPARQAAEDHRKAVRVRLTAMAVAVRVAQPERLAEQLALLMDGIYAGAGSPASPELAAAVSSAAATLIGAQIIDSTAKASRRR